MKRKILPFALGFLLLGQLAWGQSRPVKGQILDESGQPVVGAAIQIKGTQQGTITDANGNFSLDVPDENNVLIIKSYGFTTQEVQVGDGLQPLTIHFAQNSNTLNDIVVVGYGTESRKTVIGGASTIKGEEMSDVPIGSFTNILQGKASGVQVTAQNGAPGAPAFVRIRGTASISAGQEPLYVIDGVPVTSDAYNALNPNDIDDISILKDASTTAIYGSRGSNGVVMITTKSGAGAGTPKIRYGFQYGIKSKTPDNYEMMGFQDKLKIERDLGYTNEYLDPLVGADGYNGVDEVPDNKIQSYWDKLLPYQTDWFDELLRNGHFIQNDISVSGSNERTDYYLSFQTYREDGISLGSDFERKTGTFSLNQKVNDWLRMGQNATLSFSKSRLLRDRFNVQNPFAALYFYQPYESPYDFVNGINGFNPTTQGFNIVEAIQTNTESRGNLYGLSSTYLEVQPYKELKIRTQLGLQYANMKRESFTQPNSILDIILNGFGNPTGSKTDNGSDNFNYVWTNTAEYSTYFGDDHRFRAIAGTEFTKNKFSSYSLGSEGYLFPDLNTQNNGANPISTTTSKSSYSLMSYFGRLEYGYQNKYLANFSLRNDGSSRFGVNKQFGTFVAGGLAWVLSEESFLKGNSIINYLKLWGSIGTSGNDAIPLYDHFALYRTGGYDNQGLIYPATPGNEDLTWEKNTNYSAGFDFYMFDNKLVGSFDFFNKYTYSLLLNKPISSTTGFGSQLFNVGAVRNRGVELTLDFKLLSTPDWNWTIGGNFTYNKNRVQALVNDNPIADPNAAFNYYNVGMPIGVYYIQKFAGIDKTNGDELWYKADGSTTNDYNEAEQFFLEDKTPNPTYYGGIRTNVSYKGIGLGVNLYYSGGNWIYNNQWLMAHYLTFPGDQNLATDAFDYWRPDNMDAKYPRPDLGEDVFDSDKWLQKGDFWRVRDITLSYNLPSSIIKKAKMQELQIYVQGHNLWYYAPHYMGDPEVGFGSQESGLLTPGTISLYSYPTARTFTFGLNVTF